MSSKRSNTSSLIVKRLTTLFEDADQAAKNDYYHQLACNRVTRALMLFMKEQRSRVKPGKSVYERLEKKGGLFGDITMMHEHIFESMSPNLFSAQPFVFLSEHAVGTDDHARFGGNHQDFTHLMLLGIKSTPAIEQALASYAKHWKKTGDGDEELCRNALRSIIDTPEWVAFYKKFRFLMDVHEINAFDDESSE